MEGCAACTHTDIDYWDDTAHPTRSTRAPQALCCKPAVQIQRLGAAPGGGKQTPANAGRSSRAQTAPEPTPHLRPDRRFTRRRRSAPAGIHQAPPA